MKQIISLMLLSFTIVFVVSTAAKADPCGMVPPIWTGNQSPITRIGLQKTYVFHKDGVETFVIRPGFSGSVDNFGMLIPFPNPPEIRKVADNVFEQITNAIDPPEVVIDLRIRMLMQRGTTAMPTADASVKSELSYMSKDKVNVLKEEAVGMYEVAVLEAGSAFALKKWLDQNGYQYPEGMDKVTNEYVEQKWCFVAVKTKVAQQKGVNPKPGQRNVDPNLPSGSVFDGNVQGMGFRFKSPELVVPMRLSAFNDGELRNVVYLLTDGPRKIHAIPEEYVVRQISGKQLFDNVTKPLPLRIIGGTEKDIPAYQRNSLPAKRNPEPKNGVAKELFASDLLAVSTGQLSLRHEEEEKELLRIGEYFGLRGGEVDTENGKALADSRKATVAKGLEMLKEMTLTVVDGDFPREVISQQNLSFVEYNMPGVRNNNLNYDANLFGPGKAKDGILKVGSIPWKKVEQQIVRDHRNLRIGLRTMIGFGILGMIGTLIYRKPKSLLLLALAVGLFSSQAFAAEPASTTTRHQEDAATLVANLTDSKTATKTLDKIKALANSNETSREELISSLLRVAKKDESLPKRGWAIAALAKIGGQDVDEYLLDIHADDTQKKIVRTWAAAARVTTTRTVNGLIEKANLISQFPALGRPIGLRIVEKMSRDNSNVDVDKVLAVIQKVPQLQQALAPTIMAFGPDQLADVMIKGKEQNVRRTAASYLGAIAQQGNSEQVVASVIERLKFSKRLKNVPWEGGPLFVPGITWNKDDARALVGNLVRWNLWCDLNGKSAELRQIHNNIRSLGLAKAAGYQSPGWNEVGTVAWLKAWGKAVGRQEIEAILKEQGVDGNDKYIAALDGLTP